MGRDPGAIELKLTNVHQKEKQLSNGRGPLMTALLKELAAGNQLEMLLSKLLGLGFSVRFCFSRIFDVDARRRHLIVHRDPRPFF